MNGNPAEQFFEDLLPYLEKLDAQIGAIIEVLKEKGLLTEQEFAAKVERSDVGSEVRDRGLRARMEYLFSLASKKGDKAA